MEKRDAMFFLLVLGGGGYAAFANWDTISTRLGLADMVPGKIKAIGLAKDSTDLEPGITNSQAVEARQKRGDIEADSDPWSVVHLGQQDYRVSLHWTEDSVAKVHTFRVDIAASTVEYEGELDQPATPR